MGPALSEPVLTDLDRAEWAAYLRRARAHGSTAAHRRRVEEARAVTRAFLRSHPLAYVAWSGGKDSTALVALAAEVAEEVGWIPVALSIKDDLDFPGEEEYVRSLADRLGYHLDVVHPAVSLQGWLRARGPGLAADADFHGRRAALSREGFYPLIDAYVTTTGRRAVLLGLRAEESKGRAANLGLRGATYRRADGTWVGCPLARWDGVDVFAYLLRRGIEPLPIYRCCRLHGGDPGRVRKSWWVPGASTRLGGMAWLRTYWPSLHARLGELVPSARFFG